MPGMWMIFLAAAAIGAYPAYRLARSLREQPSLMCIYLPPEDAQPAATPISQHEEVS